MHIQEFAPLQSDSGEQLITLYAGISALESGSPEEARELFEQLLKDETMSEHARWYLALLNVRQGNYEQARVYLDELITTSRYYRDIATELAGEL